MEKMIVIVGLFTGLINGVILMCLVQVNRENKYFKTIKAIKWLGSYINTRVEQAERLEKEKVEGMKEFQKIYNHYFKEELE
jgi:hypothetical protein